MKNQFFEPNFMDEEEEDEAEQDAVVCSTCKGTFLLPGDTEADVCPLCGIKFDGEGD